MFLNLFEEKRKLHRMYETIYEALLAGNREYE